jgi:chemotaxis protein CheD
LDRFLQIGEFYFGSGHVRVQTVLGTCVAITLWHPERRLGGICHYLLPSRGEAQSSANAGPGVYADEVIVLFEKSVIGARTQASQYVVKLIGGGHMFPEQLQRAECRAQACSDARRADCASIGCRNISAGRRLLAERGFAIASEHVGGHGSRRVSFDVWSGDVRVRRGVAMREPLRKAR